MSDWSSSVRLPKLVRLDTKPALHTEEIVLPVDFVCSSKYGEEPGEASCVSNLFFYSIFYIMYFCWFSYLSSCGVMATSAQKFTSKHAPNLWSGKPDWQDGEIKSATVETGIPEGGTVEDSSQFQFSNRSLNSLNSVSPPKQKSHFLLKYMTFTQKHLKCCLLPLFFQYSISFWIGWILSALKKNTQHTQLFLLLFSQALWVCTSVLLDYFFTPRWDERMNNVSWVVVEVLIVDQRPTSQKPSGVKSVFWWHQFGNLKKQIQGIPAFFEGPLFVAFHEFWRPSCCFCLTLLMQEILHHLTCMKPCIYCKYWDELYIIYLSTG